MKQLIINNQTAILPDNIKFPFSIKTLDLDNPTLIKIPTTKEFTLPRCAQNDAIFGGIDNLNHTSNIYSYNQLAKTEYILLNNNSEVVSKGLVIVSSIDKNNYYVRLFDIITDLIDQFDVDKMYEISSPKANKMVYSTQYITDVESNDIIYQKDFEGETTGYTLGYVNSDISNNYFQFEYFSETTAVIIVRIIYSGTTYLFNETIEIENTNDTWKKLELPISVNTLNLKKCEVKIYSDDTASVRNFMISDKANNVYNIAPIRMFSPVESYSVLPDLISSDAAFIFDTRNLNYQLKSNCPVISTFNKIDTNNFETESIIGRSGTTLTIQEADGLNLETLGIIEQDGVMHINTVIDMLNNHYGNVIRLDADLDVYVPLATREPNDMKKEKKISGSTTNLLNYAKYTSNGDYADWSFDIINKNNTGTYNLDIDVDFSLEKNSIYTVLIPTKNNAPVCFIYSGITYYLASDYSGADTSTYKKLVNGTKVGECYFGISDGLSSGDTRALVKYSLIYGENVFVTTSGTVGSTSREIKYNIILNVGVQTDIVSDDTNKHYFIFEYKPNELVLNDAISPTLIASYSYLTSDYTISISQDKVHCFDYFNLNKLLPSCTVKEWLLVVAKYFNLNITNEDGVLVLDKKKYSYSEEELKFDINKTNIELIQYQKLILSTNTPDASEIEKYNDNTSTKWCQQLINTGYQIKKTKQEITFNTNIPIYVRPYNNWTYSNLGSNVSGTYCKYGVGGTEGMSNKIGFGFLKKNTPNNTFVVFNQTVDKVKNVFYYIRNNPQLYIPSGNTRIWYDTSITPTSGGTWTTLPYFHTLVPYQFENGVISKSLELNKPQYNYGMITDDMYSDDVTLYSNVFKSMYSDIYNADTYKLDVSMYIDGNIDVQLNKIYNIYNSLFVITEVDEYDPTVPDYYDVKLLRVNDKDNYINNNNW